MSEMKVPVFDCSASSTVSASRSGPLSPARRSAVLLWCAPALLCLFAAGCSRMQDILHASAPFEAAVPVSSPSAEASQAAQAATAPARPGKGEHALEIWNDPKFQRQFAYSYLAATDAQPSLTAAERELVLKVGALKQAEKTDEALRSLQKANNEAASAVIDFMIGNIHFEREELDQAAAAYEVAVVKHETYRAAWRNLGLVRLRQGDFEKALPSLTRMTELGGGDKVTYGLLGYAYSSVEDHLAAESAYRMAILLDPGELNWKMGLARSFFKQERYAEAVALCGRLIADHPERAELWVWQANAYIGLNQPLKAAENFELVDRLGKATFENLNTLGDIYVNQDLHEMAVDCYARAMRADQECGPERAVRAARVLQARGAMEEIERLVGHIETLRGDALSDADRKEVLRLRARIAVAKGAGDEEARVLEQIVELDPLDGEALILLGQHSSAAGDADRAVFWYERAEALENKDHKADASVRHAQLLVRQGKFAEALPLLRKAQELKPRDNVQQYLNDVERMAKSR